MANTPTDASIPPVEPVPVVVPAAVVPPAPPVPPVVDPYAAVPPPPPASYGAPSYAPAYQPGYYGAPQPPKGLSIASLVLGIAGAFFSFAYGLGLFPSIAAVITGHLARKRQPYARGLSLAGLICGYVGLGISLLWIVGIVLVVVFVAASPGYGSDY
jgi:hypothetical protein